MKLSIETLKEIFISVFSQNVDINLDTKREDIVEWDSLSHLNLIVELEDVLNVSFSKEEIMSMNSIKEIISVIEKK
jgi:acyl carrier protein